MGKKVFDDVLGFDPPNIPPPPVPPKSPPPPDITAAADRARQQREAQDATRRKRGRSSTVYTGPEGVGATPLGIKTLVGS
jgi:hypothetical protein